jgi:16S rRNA (guanine966-N2)-methyltransferase
MRIISGIFRGKKIFQPIDNNTRPLKDLVKESIFNIIEHSKKFKINIKEAFVLDLFSGVGSFGLECLSRGSKFVTFVENYNGVLPILKKNLINLKSVKNYKIIEKDIIKNINFNFLDQKYNLIFLDPPYKEKNLFSILNEITKKKILSQEGIIVLHRHKKQIDKFPTELKILEEKKYGLAKIIFASI